MFEQLCKQNFPITLFRQPIFTSKTYNHAVTYNHTSADGNLQFFVTKKVIKKQTGFAWNIVHELEPKKMDIWPQRIDKNIIQVFSTSGCLLSRKVWWAVQISSFWRKIEIFYRPEWTKVMNVKINFRYFQIQEWILQTGRAEKVGGKNGLICVVFMFPSWVMILN